MRPNWASRAAPRVIDKRGIRVNFGSFIGRGGISAGSDYWPPVRMRASGFHSEAQPSHRSKAMGDDKSSLCLSACRRFSWIAKLNCRICQRGQFWLQQTPAWFNRQCKYQQFRQVMGIGKSDPRLLQPCLQIFFGALLTVKANRIVAISFT